MKSRGVAFAASGAGKAMGVRTPLRGEEADNVWGQRKNQFAMLLERSNPETSHCLASHIRKSILLHNSHYITSAKGTALEKTEQEDAGVLFIGAFHQSITPDVAVLQP